MSVDPLRNGDAISTLIHTIASRDIDSACVQETHSNRIDAQENGNYAIFYGGRNASVITTNNFGETQITKKKPYNSGVGISIKN